MRRLTDGEREVLAELEWDARDWAPLEGDVDDAEDALDTCPPPPPMSEGPTTDPFDSVTPPF